MADTEDDLRILRCIIGTELESVTFVRDYVQLSFDGSSLTAVNVPTVVSLTENETFNWGASEYRNALCSHIGQIVRDVSIVYNDKLTIQFSKSVIFISLKSEDYVTVEAVIFRSRNGGATLVI